MTGWFTVETIDNDIFVPPLVRFDPSKFSCIDEDTGLACRIL